MNIKKLKLVNFKNIENSTVIFKNNISGIYGPNGMGKTAIIEAISLIKEYLKIPTNKNSKEDTRRSTFLKLLDSSMSKNKDVMSLEITLSYNDVNIKDNDLDYIIFLEFKRIENTFICTNECIHTKKTTRGTIPVEVIKVINEDLALPKISYMGTPILTHEAMIYSKKIREILDNSINFYSQLMLVPEYISDKQKINKMENIIATINNILEKTIILTLNKQLHCTETVNIPIHCYDEKNNTIKTIIYDGEKNIYSTQEAELLENTINKISSIFSEIIPDTKLDFNSLDANLNPITKEVVKKAVSITIEKDDIQLLLTVESTGIIKLVSLLSALVYCIKDQNATVLIDEFDVHIFEYLLSIVLTTIEKYAKGQLIFTAHNLLPMETLNNDSIIIATLNKGEKIYTHLKVSNTSNKRKKYLKSQYMWSEDNIDPLMINAPALELYIKRLVRK